MRDLYQIGMILAFGLAIGIAFAWAVHISAEKMEQAELHAK